MKIIRVLMNNKFLFLLLAITAFTFSSYSQNSRDNTSLYGKKPVISSPNAAALEKYVDFPIANYTGTVDISVPIHDIKIKGVDVPIALSYHCGGIKVDEVSSDIGIGWSLFAGGCINIQPNGIMDELSGYPFHDPTYFNRIKNNDWSYYFPGGMIDCSTALIYSDPAMDPYTLYSGTDYAFLKGVIQEAEDAEPDLYAFNFIGHTGKFFEDENGVFRTIPYSELKIERIIENTYPAGYKITDENGNIFEFRTLEKGYEHISGNPYLPITRYDFSYYLSKITTLQGETIEFNYSNEYNYSYDLQKSSSRARTSASDPCYQFNQQGEYAYFTETTSLMAVLGRRIESIQASDGTLVKFLYSDNDRTDLPGTKALEKIEVWDSFFENKKIKEFTLNHDYSTGRLTLTSVQKSGEPATSFVYNGALPARLSYSQDHYGYYNNRSNTTLMPMDEYNEFWQGADRSINPDATQAGMLTKIIHPTGGQTEYFYEPNWYYIPDATIAYPKTMGPYVESRPNTTTSQTFTIPANAEKIRINYNDTYDGTNIHNDYCIIHLTGPNNYSQDFMGSYSSLLPSLSPGDYTISIENVGSTYSANAWIFWFEKTDVSPHNELGGGVRIKEIRKSDNNGGAVMVKNFSYNQSGTDLSSGVGVWQPMYLRMVEHDVNDGNTCNGVSCRYWEQSSASISPLTFTNGNFVAYKEVSVYSQDFSKNGYTDYKYLADYGGFNISIPSFPYGPRILYDWTNGSLLEQTDYIFSNNQYRPITKKKNYYNYNFFSPSTADPAFLFKTYGAKIAVKEPPFICWAPCVANQDYLATVYSGLLFGIQQYMLYSSWHRLDKTEETSYGNSESDAITNTTSYFYENPNSIQATRIETTNSKGETIIQKLKYAKDYASYGFVSDLILRNVLVLPIEKYTLKKKDNGNSYVTDGQIQTYKAGVVLPDKIYSFENRASIPVSSYTESSINSSGTFFLDNQYKEKLSVNSYNNIGNITELQKKDDGPISYIWDYASARPVAEVVNATSASIAYTSFEADGLGNWNFGSGVLNTYGVTGAKSYPFSNGVITKSDLNSLTEYMVSYWSNGGACSVSGSIGNPIQGKTVNIDGINWTFYRHKISGVSNVTISGTALIDELRLYPSTAQMTTYTYDPLIGITSLCDAGNRISYYEYDEMGRLIRIRDADKNILKQFEYKYQVIAHSTGIWVATGNTRCKPCPSNGSYISNILQQEEKDTNPQSATYNQTRWTDAGTSSNCVVNSDWQNTGSAQCLTDGNGFRTGIQHLEQRDINPCSSTYNQIRYLDITNTGACPPNAPNWQNTGNTRCKPCPDNSRYITNVLQQEQKDDNPSSTTYNQTRWVDAGSSANCLIGADWQATGSTRCRKDAAGYNTGEKEEEQKDVNPCSSTYNQLRWIVLTGSYTDVCPLPCPNCNGIDKKCILGNCETGIRVCDSYYFDSSQGVFVNFYHYEFSDGSWSDQFSETGYCDCYGTNCL